MDGLGIRGLDLFIHLFLVQLKKLLVHSAFYRGQFTYREKRSSAQGRVCYFPSWPKVPTG